MTPYINMYMASFMRLFPCLVFLLITMATPAMPEALPRPTDAPIQDQANALSQPVIDDLETMVKADGRPIRLVIVPDRLQYGGTGSFTEYVDALAQNRGINEHPLAIMVVHDIKPGNIALRLGHGYTDQYRRSARTLINRIYQQYLQYQLYNAGYSKGIAALIEHLPKFEYPTRSKPSRMIALKDNGALIQDHVGTIVPNERDTFAMKLAAQIQNGQMLRLVIIQRHQDLNNDTYLAAFANTLFDQWGMNDLHNSVLVLYEAQSNTVMLRLGYGFTPAESLQAFEVLNTVYKHLLRQDKFSQAHQMGMLAIVQALGKRPEQVAIPPQVQGTPTVPNTPTAPVTPTPPNGADLLISPHNTGALVQDSAGVLTPAAVFNLNAQIKGFEPAKIRILTVQNYLYHTNSQDFQTYANKLFSSWQLSLNPSAIFIVHDVKYNRIAVAFGSKYSQSEQIRLRDLLQTAYAPGLRQGLMNAAHMMGVKALIDGFYAPVSQTGTPPDVDREQTATAPKPSPPNSPSLLLGAMSVIALILAIVAIVAFLTYRKSTKDRRMRTARISAWKRVNKLQK